MTWQAIRISRFGGPEVLDFTEQTTVPEPGACEVRIKSFLSSGRHAAFALLRDGAIHPVVIDRLPLSSARDVHARIDTGGLGGKI